MILTPVTHKGTHNLMEFRDGIRVCVSACMRMCAHVCVCKGTHKQMVFFNIFAITVFIKTVMGVVTVGLQSSSLSLSLLSTTVIMHTSLVIHDTRIVTHSIHNPFSSYRWSSTPLSQSAHHVFGLPRSSCPRSSTPHY